MAIFLDLPGFGLLGPVWFILPLPIEVREEWRFSDLLRSRIQHERPANGETSAFLFLCPQLKALGSQALEISAGAFRAGSGSSELLEKNFLEGFLLEINHQKQSAQFALGHSGKHGWSWVDQASKRRIGRILYS